VLTGTAEPPKPAPRSMFAGFALDVAAVPESQLFVVPVQQRGLVRVLAERAGEYDVDIRWGHVVTGFDQHDDGVTVHVAGLDGAYDLTAKYLVGADGGTSQTRHLAGIEFPGMSSYDLVVRRGSTCCRQTNGSTRSAEHSTYPGPMACHPCGSIERSEAFSRAVRWGAAWWR